MNVSATAMKYARALGEVAAEEGNLDQVGADLVEFLALYAGHDQLRSALANPAIPVAAKRAIVEQVAERMGLQRASLNVLRVLLERNRIHLFEEVVEGFSFVRDEMAGVVSVDVYSARYLGGDLRRRLTEALEHLTSHGVRCGYHIDEDLLGGIKIRMGSKVFDGTLKTQLEAVQKRLVHA